MRTLLSTIVAALLASCATSSSRETGSALPDLKRADPNVLTVGLVSATSSASTLTQAQAFGAFVKQATGKETRPAVFPDYDSFAEAIARGAVDVGFMPPLAYVRATAHGKVQPLLKSVRAGQTTYRSVLFVPSSSALKSLEDFRKAKNLKAAWVDSSSATGYIFPKALLLTNKINPAGAFVSQNFLGNHDAVCRAVSSGQADVGATFSDDPTTGPATHASGCKASLGEGTDKVRIVGATAGIPNDVLVVSATLPDAEREALRSTAEKLQASEEGKKILQAAFLAEGFAPAKDEDYEPVRAILDVFKQ